MRAQAGAVARCSTGTRGAVAQRAFELLDRGGRMLSFGLVSGTWADIDAAEAQRRGVTVIRRQRTTRRSCAPSPSGGAAEAHAAIEAPATGGKIVLEGGAGS